MEKTYTMTMKLELQPRDFDDLAETLRNAVDDYVKDCFCSWSWWDDADDETKARISKEILKDVLEYITKS